MNRRHWLASGLVVACLAGIVLLCGCYVNIGSDTKAKYTRTEEHAIAVGQATGLDVQTDVGSITVKGGDGSDCVLKAKITGKAQTEEKARKIAEGTKVDAEIKGEKLVVRVNKPTGVKGDALSVDLEITAPKGLDIECKTNVGDVTVSGMSGQVGAVTNVGSILCEGVVGELGLRTNVGDINARYDEAAPAECKAKMETNVGSIEFLGPRQMSAKVSASTEVGGIASTTPITVVGKVVKSLNGTVEGGAGRVILRTNVGSIEIR